MSSKKLFYAGQFRRAIWLADESGRFRAEKYFTSSQPRDRAKLQSLIEKHCDERHGIRNKQKFRHEEDGIFVFKSFQDRLFCFEEQDRLYITHGLRKKQDALLRKDLEIAFRLRRHHQAG